MINGIKVRILGDFGPFSTMGKSIGYEICIGKSVFLVDCGAPLFQQIGSPRFKHINGLFITHNHDDHKRWFTDLALYNYYEEDNDNKVSIFTSENIQKELVRASGPALETSLDMDSNKIIDISIVEYAEFNTIGPKARYSIGSVAEGNAKTSLRIFDADGYPVSPDKAKIVISNKTKKPRMLFKDPTYAEWIEPESFYPFSSNIFYENNENIFKSSEGFTIKAIKSPVWHGISNIGIKIMTDNETLIFSSDTVNNKYLWEQLHQEKREQNLQMSRKDFERAEVIYGDINDYIERTWSEERYTEAIRAFDDAIVIHDISFKNSVVHTDYEKLNETFLEKEKVILTHSPDIMISEWMLSFTDKIFKIVRNSVFEMIDSKLYPMNADIYYKDAGNFYVGFKNIDGKYNVYEKDGLLTISNGTDGNDSLLYKVDLYEDISGKYFPKLENKNKKYLEREDGKVELIEFTENGSTGRIIENYRDRLLKREKPLLYGTQI